MTDKMADLSKERAGEVVGAGDRLFSHYRIISFADFNEYGRVRYYGSRSRAFFNPL